MRQFCRIGAELPGDEIPENYVEHVETLVKIYGNVDCSMSIKIRILHTLLVKAKGNMGVYTDWQDERFLHILDFGRCFGHDGRLYLGVD